MRRIAWLYDPRFIPQLRRFMGASLLAARGARLRT